MESEFYGYCDIYYIFSTIQQALKAGRKKVRLSQEAFYHGLFREFVDAFHQKWTAKSSIGAYLNGTKPLPKELIGFYDEPQNYNTLCRNIQEIILQKLPDHTSVVQEIFEALDADDHLTDSKRTQFFQIRSRYFAEDHGFQTPKGSQEALLCWESRLLTDILLFVVKEPIYLRNASDHAPILRDGFQNEEPIHFHIVPEPYIPFFGREQELSDLDELFKIHPHIFLTGMAGLGKSELAKTYAARYRDIHHHTFYIFYTGSLKSDIIRMVNTASTALIPTGAFTSSSLAFLSQRIDVPAQDQFQRSMAYLWSLGPEDLIILDNFDALPAALSPEGSTAFSSDPLIQQILNLRCRLLINTRCSFDQMQLGSSPEFYRVQELNTPSLLNLFCHYYPEAENHRKMAKALIQAVFSNTLLVKLVAKLLQDSFLSPEEVLQKLREDLTLSGIDDHITCEIDGVLYSQAMSCHLHTMLKLFGVTDAQMEILKYMSLMPLAGVSRNTFRTVAGLQNSVDLQKLIYMGFLQRNHKNQLSMHPLIRDVILHTTKPTYLNCAPLLQNLDQICSKQLGQKNSFCTETAAVIDSLVFRLDTPREFQKENRALAEMYLHFVQDALPFQYFHSQMESSVNLYNRVRFLAHIANLYTPLDWFILIGFRYIFGDEADKQSRKKGESFFGLMSASPLMITDSRFEVICLDTLYSFLKNRGQEGWKQDAVANVIKTIGCHAPSRMVRLFCFPISLYLGQKELGKALLALPPKEEADCSGDTLKSELNHLLEDCRLENPEEEGAKQQEICELSVN